uniref:Gamma-secretase subunit PEN-2 n=1 Tax=Caenorhabditis japonica TaxID=281687 RepID=A0A8R1HGF4_CAEJA
MDISKLSDVKRVDLCKKYFLIGFCLLPLVWIVNTFWFFSDAFCFPINPHRRQIRKYVIGSIIGSLFWAILIASWEIFFQYYRAQGLVWSDKLTFVFPTGRV